jgi:hypothetical protein
LISANKPSDYNLFAMDYILGFWLKPIEWYYLPPAEAGGY